MRLDHQSGYRTSKQAVRALTASTWEREEGETHLMALNKWATRFAITLSVPIMLLASFIALVAILSSSNEMKIDCYDLSNALFLFFGYPITRIVNIFAVPGGLQDRDIWWALPLLNLLLLSQWIIWAQMIALIGRFLLRLSRPFARPAPPLQSVWPDHIVKADGRRYRLRTSQRDVGAFDLRTLSNPERTSR